MSAAEIIRRSVLERAYMNGFAKGADDTRARRRTKVDQDPQIHASWIAGYDAGRRACDAARNEYRSARRALDQAADERQLEIPGARA